MVGFPLTVVLNCGRRGGRSVRIKNKTAGFFKARGGANYCHRCESVYVRLLNVEYSYLCSRVELGLLECLGADWSEGVAVFSK